MLYFRGLILAFANFILREPGKEETKRSHGAASHKPIYAVERHFTLHDEKLISVYNGDDDDNLPV